MSRFITFEEAYGALDVVDGPTNSGWYQVICPSHDDDNRPSLGIIERPDGTLGVNCVAGCTQREVYDAIRELLG